MKLEIIFTILLSIFSMTEIIGPIKCAKKNIKSDEQKAIIYGNFIQRLGFKSGGFPQDIYLLNSRTNNTIILRVKRTFKSSKENIMCFQIPEGKYELINYRWTESKWYGGTVFDEPIIKVQDDISYKYSFEVEAGKIYYVGTWDFDTKELDFKDEKNSFDEFFENEYKNLLIHNAHIAIPTYK